MRKYRYFFHYNKPLSRKLGKQMITLHFKNKCHFLEGDKFICKTECEGKVNPTQPVFVMQGFCEDFIIEDGIGYVK
jgi:hypothetical protein